MRFNDSQAVRLAVGRQGVELARAGDTVVKKKVKADDEEALRA